MNLADKISKEAERRHSIESNPSSDEEDASSGPPNKSNDVSNNPFKCNLCNRESEMNLKWMKTSKNHIYE